MTAIRSTPSARRTLIAAGVVGTGCAVLTARPAIVAVSSQPIAALLGIFVVLAAVGLALPVPVAPIAVPTPTVRRWVVLGLGIALFAVGRVLSGGRAAGLLTLGALALHAVAAIAEEIWFRRVVYGWLAPAGRGVAILGSAALFAAVHVTTYGVWVLPLDLAAGLVFAWQRAESGSWRIPAVTHVVANVLALW